MLEDIIAVAAGQVLPAAAMKQHLSHYRDSIAKDGYFTIKRHPDQQADVWIQIHSPEYAGMIPPGPHRHDFFELIYVHSGSFMNEIGGVLTEQTQDTLYLLNPMVAHKPWIKEKTDIVFNILITKSAVESAFLYLLRNNSLLFNFFLNSIYDPSLTNGYLVFDRTPKLQSIIVTMIEEYFKQEDFYQEILSARLLQLLAVLSSSAPQQEQKGASGKGVLTAAHLLEYIDRNIASVTADSISAHFHYSFRHITRLLKESTGESFSAVVNQRRLQKAKLLFENSNFPVSRVLEVVGFQDPSYFYKLFQKYFGVSFSVYRKSLAKNK